MARLTGLEPATPGVTGRYSNQLSYNRPLREGPSTALRRGRQAVWTGFCDDFFVRVSGRDPAPFAPGVRERFGGMKTGNLVGGEGLEPPTSSV